MLRSTGVAEDATCMVYLAISKLQAEVVRRMKEGLEKAVKIKKGGRMKKRKDERREKTKKNQTRMC